MGCDHGLLVGLLDYSKNPLLCKALWVPRKALYKCNKLLIIIIGIDYFTWLTLVIDSNIMHLLDFKYKNMVTVGFLELNLNK